jgi:hypothetical protein
MECTVARNWLFRKLDEELSHSENEQLDRHLATCDSCARQLKLLMIPRRLSRAIPVLEISPYFYQKLKARINGEAQSITMWQIIMGLSRQILPVMAAITLALLSVFAYFQFRSPNVDFYQAYDSIFMPTDRPQRMVIADHEDITDESVYLAITEQTSTQHLSASPEMEGK